MDFLQETDMIISVCDADGTIVYMNDKAKNYFQEPGTPELTGSNILDCHPEPSKSQLKKMMTTHETQSLIKGEGEKRRIIHQTPIYKNKKFNGYIEIIIPLINLTER